jgi:hypothetical protein
MRAVTSRDKCQGTTNKEKHIGDNIDREDDIDSKEKIDSLAIVSKRNF